MSWRLRPEPILSPQRLTIITGIRWVAALVVLLALGYYATQYVTSSDTLDLQIYLDSAERLQRGESLYDVRYSFPERATDFELQYLYPPALAAILAPLTFLPRPLMILLWQSGLVVALATTSLLLARLLRNILFEQQRVPLKQQRHLSFSALFLFLALWPPTLDGILWGQVNGYILLLLVASIYFQTKRNDSLCGLTLGFAAALKATPLLLAVPLVVFRRWRAVLFCGVGSAVLHAPLLLYPHGVQAIPEFVRTTSEIASGHVVNDPHYDYSLRRVVHLFWEAPAALFSTASLLLVALFAIQCELRRRSSLGALSSGTYERSLTSILMLCGLPVMIAASPLVWFHHLVWLYPALAVCMYLYHRPGIRITALLLYFTLAPLLYIHVYLRHFIQHGEAIVKCVPLVAILAVYLLTSAIAARAEPPARTAQ